MTFLPSPSKLGLAEICAFPWWRLAPHWPARSAGSFAGFGSALGKAAEAHVKGEAVEVDALALEANLAPARAAALALCVQHVRDYLDALRDTPGVTGLRAEVPFAWHAEDDTGRECGSRLPGADASDERPGERSGSVDLIYWRDGELVILDWKTGPRAMWHRPRETPQLVMYALAAARAHGAPRAAVALAHVSADGVVVAEDGLSAFDLDVAALRFRSLFRYLSTGEDIVPVPGPHCTDSYCPIVAVCPVTLKALAAIDAASVSPPLAVSTPDQITSVEHAAGIRVRLKMVRELCKVSEELALQPYVLRNGPIPLGNGRVYGAMQNEGNEKVDLKTDGAIEAMTKHLGAFGVDVAIERSTSKTAIHQAAVAVAPKGKAAGVERGLLDELRSIEACKRGAPYQTFEEWKPKDTTTTKEAA